jgi:hypothetical protein
MHALGDFWEYLDESEIDEELALDGGGDVRTDVIVLNGKVVVRARPGA